MTQFLAAFETKAEIVELSDKPVLLKVLKCLLADDEIMHILKLDQNKGKGLDDVIKLLKAVKDSD